MLASACAYYDDSLLAPLDGGPEPGGGAGGSAAGAAGKAGERGGNGAAGAIAMVGGGGGGAASASGSAGGGGTACVSRRPPGPPTSAGGGGAGADSISFTVAFRDFDFGEAPTSTVVAGYDLDGACTDCTCTGDTSSRCLPRPGATKAAITDGPQGEDRGARALFQAGAAIFEPISSQGVKKAVDSGQFTVLLRVSGYNGLADDTNVVVAWFVGAGLPAPPKWDGSDEWPVREYGVKNGDVNQPVSVDTAAYVRDHVLVAGPKGVDGTSREVPLQVSADFLLTVSSVFVTGRIVPSGSSYALQDSILAGKWKTEDILRQVSGLSFGGVPICPGTPLYAQIGTTICNSSDVSLFDGTPTDACNAVSLGVTFLATPARIGSVKAQPPPTNACAKPFDPAKDGCSSL